MAKKTLLEQVFLFPFSHLPDSYYRFLELTLPSMQVLGFIRPPYCPPWDKGMISVHSLSLDQHKMDLLHNIYKGYQEFARIHGEKHILETISLAKVEEELAETRTRLRSALKGYETGSSDPGWNFIVESIIFLELARDLDEKDIEVDNDLFKVKDLEDQFRASLGLESDEDFEDVEEAVRIAAEELPRRSYFGYLTRMRTVQWLRMYFANLSFYVRRCHIDEGRITKLGKQLPILLCISRDVAEELIDPVRTKEERGGFTWFPEIITLVDVPNIFEGIRDKRYAEISSSVGSHIVELWTALQDYIDQPQEHKSLIIDVASRINSIFNQVVAYDKPSIPSRFKLSVIFHPTFDILKAWQILDDSGYRFLMETQGLPQAESLPMLVFEEVPNL
ncbi:MAG: hypothetical protein WHS38_10215 [Thermodesulforhabdaceae bacterium]